MRVTQFEPWTCPDWWWIESYGWYMTGMYSSRELVRMLRPVPGVH